MNLVVDEWEPPLGIDMVNTMTVPGSKLFPEGEGQHVTLVKRCRISSRQSFSINGSLGEHFRDMYLRLCCSVRNLHAVAPIQILGLHHYVSILDEDILEIVLSANVYRTGVSRTNSIAFIALDYHRARSESRLSTTDRSNLNSVNSIDDFLQNDSKTL